jgi:hypothetical protein
MCKQKYIESSQGESRDTRSLSDISDIIIRTCRRLKGCVIKTFGLYTLRADEFDFIDSEDEEDEETPEEVNVLITEIDEIISSITTFILLIGSNRFNSLALKGKSSDSQSLDFLYDDSSSKTEADYLDSILDPTEETKKNIEVVYENSENVHQVMKGVDKFIVKFGKTLDSARVKDHWQIVREVSEYISAKGDVTLKSDCDRAIDRITTDRSVYGNDSRLTDVFDMVWTKIEMYENLEDSQSLLSDWVLSSPDEDVETIIQRCKNTLKDRFVEELKEMAGTCGSGHAARLVNVFTGFIDTPAVTFDWIEDVSNTFHLHFMKKLELESEENKDILLMASIDSEIKEANLDFISLWMEETSNEIRQILFSDYVEQGYLTAEHFENLFSQVKGRYE